MKTLHAHRLVLVGLVSTLAVSSPLAQAPDASKTPLKLIVGFPAGGALDTLARALAEHLRASSGETVLVENRPGAATRIAIDHVKRAPADGRTVLLASSAPFIIFPMTYKRIDYDVERDFQPVAHLVDVPTVISTASSSPYQTVDQYATWVRSHPGNGNVGLTSLGGALHFSILAFSKAIDVPLTPVPYKGGAQLVSNVVGGHVPLATDALASQLQLHHAGRVRILAVSGTQRNRALPDVPTLKETGIDAFAHANAWYGAYVPAKTPKAVVQQLEKAFVAAVQQPHVQAQLQSAGLEPTGRDAAAVASQLRAERDFWRPIVKSSGFKSED
ncbi:tripartite-type tricarboxylate transporter receptor subunit TctC [Hydrogenophaga palleronii]|uniref:Tripartite-type tricarboxylate transporter receptor subunit TctC n=1 Tax=Hydrogenophaga palleronii TaxID=65655 RepID=A0ABU1WNV1_9BURK|nr:tripartite tricarboxylate transporter substrate-binding protein [Hydrogenophaga palleronii]MDR7150966.1 tripartite-type tricarboxylate transporter receptor subunit TctC [Hydrogenophaga palleronii]